ncbi:MAG TPA: alpha-L-fucosidase [Planctomycetes bacterium]|nr:alpha-L-fucosidase [Planctomycetota bacterium]
MTRTAWFENARFGISFHWGVASVPGRGDGWLRSGERMSLADYEAFFPGFRPDVGWATDWAATVRSAEAGYALLTAKHHDGFCLWPSRLTDYHVGRTPAAGRDLIREFVDATRAAGLRVGLYYSLVDWRHPDYPAWGDRQHPLRHDPAAQAADAGRDWGRYLAFLHGQIRELLTDYGHIDLLVLDFSYWNMSGETWRAAELMAMIRRLQPDIVINDRLELDAIKRADPPAWAGDFDTAELDIPREQVRSDGGRLVPWDSWFPLGQSWFHDAADAAAPARRKDARMLIRALVNCVSKGGNLTLNLAPDPTGALHSHDRASLGQIGAWLRLNGESVIGAGPAGLPKPEWGRWTRQGEVLYAHLLDQPIGHLSLHGLRGRIRSGRALATGAPLVVGNYWNAGVQRFDQPDDQFINLAEPIGATHALPDADDTVLALELTDDPAVRSELDARLARAVARVPNP